MSARVPLPRYSPSMTSQGLPGDNPYSVPSTGGHTNPYSARDPHTSTQYNTAAAKRPKPSPVLGVLSYLSIAVGLIMILAAVADGGMNLILTAVLVSVPLIVIPGWRFYCLRQDHKRWDEYEAAVDTRRNVDPYLTDADRELLKGMGCLLYTSPSPRDS